MPPALRRSVSSPSVRVAPYPTSSSAPMHNTTNSAAAAVPGRPRRGGSDAAGRRVLADIEWWRVMQGQQSDEYENEQDDNAAAPDADADVDGDHPRRPPARPHTPEPTSPLYTVSEDAHTDLQPGREPESPAASATSSAASTPSRARPRAHHSLSFPGLTLAALQLRIDDDDAAPR